MRVDYEAMMIKVDRTKGVYKTDDGMYVEGYGAYFNNVDSQGEVIVKGAFAGSLTADYREKNQLNPPKFIKGHKHNGDPLGVFVEIEETDKGLWFKAKLDDTTAGREAYTQFDSGSLDSFSIGARILETENITLSEAKRRGYRTDGWSKPDVTVFKQLELIEISAVLFAANTSAKIGKKSMVTKADAGEYVKFYEGDILHTAVVLEVLDEAVELENGTIEPVEGDPVLKVDIVEENEEGELEGTGDIVYLLESQTVSEVEDVDEAEVEEAADAEEVKAASAEKSRILGVKPAVSVPAAEPAAPADTSENIAKAIDGLKVDIKSFVEKSTREAKSNIDALSTEIDKLKSTNRPSRTIKKGKEMSVKTAFGEFVEQVKASGEHATGFVKRAPMSFKGSFYKGLTTKADHPVTTQTSGLPAQNVDRRGVIDSIDETPMLRDYLKVVRTDKGNIEYIQETGAATAVTTLAAGVSSNATTITVDSPVSFFVGQEIFLEPEGSNKREKAVIQSISGSVLTLEEGLIENHAEGAVVGSVTFKFTPETEIKPAMNLAFESKSAAIKTLAHWVPVTKQALDDIDMLRSYIEDRLISGLKKTEEYQILYGKGGSEELDGITNNPNIRDYKWSQGGECDTKLDALRRAITLASHSGRRPDLIGISIDDEEDVELAKGRDGHYIYADVVSGTERRRWGLRMFSSPYIPAGQAIVGAFREGMTLWDREDISIAITDSHDNYFIRNMYAIRAEERIGLTVECPEAFVLVEFDEAPECPCCDGAPVDEGGTGGD